MDCDVDVVLVEDVGVLGLDFREGFEDDRFLLFGLWRIFFGEDEFIKLLMFFLFSVVGWIDLNIELCVFVNSLFVEFFILWWLENCSREFWELLYDFDFVKIELEIFFVVEIEYGLGKSI